MKTKEETRITLIDNETKAKIEEFEDGQLIVSIVTEELSVIEQIKLAIHKH